LTENGRRGKIAAINIHENIFHVECDGRLLQCAGSEIEPLGWTQDANPNVAAPKVAKSGNEIDPLSIPADEPLMKAAGGSKPHASASDITAPRLLASLRLFGVTLLTSKVALTSSEQNLLLEANTAASAARFGGPA
jgi:hypothetical protein